MSDLNSNISIEELFPELQGILDNWETAPQANDGLENENGIEPSDIEQAMQARLAQSPFMPQFQSGQTAPPPPQSHVEDGGPPAPTPQSVAPPASVESVPTGEGQPGAQTPAPQTDETFVVGHDEQGQEIRVSRDQALRYFQFDQDFQNDPQLRSLVLDYYQGRGNEGQVQPPASEPAPQPAPAPVTSSVQEVPELDLDDPAIRFLLQQQQQLAEQVQMLAGGVQQTQSQQQAQQQAQNEALIKRAMTSFQTEHSLNDDSMNNIRQAAARLNVLPSLMQGVDPITGAPSRPDPLTAMERAFEIAMMMSPEHRQQEFAREVQRRVTDSRRKQKLAGLSGSSGSVPRTTPAPTTEQGRRSAMIDEIRQMQEGGWSPPES